MTPRQTQTTVGGRQVQGDESAEWDHPCIQAYHDWLAAGGRQVQRDLEIIRPSPGVCFTWAGGIMAALSPTVTIKVDPFADADEPTVVEGGK